MTDVTLTADDARFLADKLRTMGQTGRVERLVDLLDPQRPTTDAARLMAAADRLDVTTPIITIDPAVGVVVTEQVKTIFYVVAHSRAHGSAAWPCQCLVCAAVHHLADLILRDRDG